MYVYVLCQAELSKCICNYCLYLFDLSIITNYYTCIVFYLFFAPEAYKSQFYVYCKDNCNDVKPGKIRVRCKKCRNGAFEVDRVSECTTLQTVHILDSSLVLKQDLLQNIQLSSVDTCIAVIACG